LRCLDATGTFLNPKVARVGPDILCYTLNSAAGIAAVGERKLIARVNPKVGESI